MAPLSSLSHWLGDRCNLRFSNSRNTEERLSSDAAAAAVDKGLPLSASDLDANDTEDEVLRADLAGLLGGPLAAAEASLSLSLAATVFRSG
jgi:hypothetical protein